ncbi:Uncharacterised protein [Vibrio cholerae]|nr:Uncharacterised protein [Vibrio cholerae]CSC22710.1 Uncharacterised protein [Vibrio cholerae]
MDSLTRHIQPVMQMWVVRDQLFDFLIGFVNVFRIARECRPTEGTYPFTEEWTNIGRHKTGEVERIGNTFFQRHLANVIAIVQRRSAASLQIKHGAHLDRHRSFGSFDDFSFILLTHLCSFFHAPAEWQIAIEWIVCRRLICHHIRGDVAFD